LEKRWPTLENPEEWCLNVLIEKYPDMDYEEVCPLPPSLLPLPPPSSAY
jgi:hypothetical protein